MSNDDVSIGREVLALKMPDNDADVPTVGLFLKSLLQTLWLEGESFSGKRPFGNSGWQGDVSEALERAGWSRAGVEQAVMHAIDAAFEVRI